jgi:hypothetical protein
MGCLLKGWFTEMPGRRDGAIPAGKYIYTDNIIYPPAGRNPGLEREYFAETKKFPDIV